MCGENEKTLDKKTVLMNDSFLLISKFIESIMMYYTGDSAVASSPDGASSGSFINS